MPRHIDLVGQKFSYLIVLSRNYHKKGTYWNCYCSCGNITLVRSDSLKNGNTKSCGCLFKYKTKQSKNKRHGMTKSTEFNTWVNLRERCFNVNRPDYKNYGGRGITVCDRWLESFENFFEDMGPCLKGKSLDRWSDNGGDYEPNNCRWATLVEQRANCRPVSCGPHKQCWFFAFNLNTGEWLEDDNQSEFARQYGLNQGHVGNCLYGRRKTHKGWIFEFLT